MADAALAYRQAFKEGLRPEMMGSVHEWAEAHRVLSGIGCPEPGPWRTSRTPYLREPMECLSASSRTRRVVLMFGSQLGKALALDTPILTVDGWSTMGDLKKGDQVFDMHGNPTQVVRAWPVMHDRECVRITFSDGSQVVADMDHQWVVDDDDHGAARRKRMVITTREIAATYKRGKRNRYAIPVAGPLRLPPVELPIHPYVLGVWLGDGNSHSNQITMEAKDAEEVAVYLRACSVRVDVRRPDWIKGKAVNMLLDAKNDRAICRRGHVAAEVGVYWTTKKDGTRKWSCAECQRQFAMASKYGKPVDPISNPRIGERLRALGLIGKGKKRIPRIYLQASVKQRLELLRGLMDTDGHCTVKGAHEVTFASTALADDVFDLILSLGLKPVKKRHPGHTTINFTAYRSAAVFRLQRKKDRVRSAVDGRSSETRRRRIVNVEPVPSVPVRCITVAAKTQTYLCGRELIPTHNTEVGLNWLGYIIHWRPAPTLLAQPTIDMAKRLNRQRLEPFVRDTPVIAERIPPPRARDSGNTAFLKVFPGGLFVLTGANSASAGQSMPAANLFADEVSSYPIEMDDKGDPLENFEARTANFRNGKILITSTPGEAKACRVTKEFETRSDRRSYHVPCPACGAHQRLIWSQFKWERAGSDVLYECSHCGERFEERHKARFLPEGVWVPSAAGDGMTAGFHLPGWYAPLGWISWDEIRDQFVRAQTDRILLKGWVNKRAAEAWRDEIENQFNADGLAKRRQDTAAGNGYPIGTVPEGVLVITAGVDVQGGGGSIGERLVVTLWGWGRGEEGWHLGHFEIHGDPQADDVWEQLDRVSETQWERADGAQLVISMGAIDDGGHATHKVRDYCRTRQKWVPVKGSSQRGKAIIGKGSAVDVNRKNQAVQKRSVLLYPIGTDTSISHLQGRLRNETPGPGYLHLGEAATDQFLAELFPWKRKPKMVKGFTHYDWILPQGEHDEGGDCTRYAYAALLLFSRRYAKSTMWKQLERQLTSSTPKQPPPAPPVATDPLPTRRRPTSQRRSGFVTGW